MGALLEQLPEKSSPVVITVKPERPSPDTPRTNGHRTINQGPLYDPATVFVLELATVLAMRDAESIAALGQAVADALHTVVRDAAKVHPLVLSRAVYYLLHLLNASQVRLSNCLCFVKIYWLTCIGALLYPCTGHTSHNIKL